MGNSKLLIIVGLILSSFSRASSKGIKEDIIDRTGVILSIGSDIYFIDEILRSEAEVLSYLRSTNATVDKIILTTDKPMKMLFRGNMNFFYRPYFPCGSSDSINEIKYIPAKLVFESRKKPTRHDLEQRNRNNELCIYQWGVDGALYLNYHIYGNYLVNVRWLKN